MRYFITYILCLFLLGCLGPTKKQDVQLLVKTLDAKALSAFHKGHTILFYAYSDKIAETEAYADWAAYLNDFQESSNADVYFSRVQKNALVPIFPQLANHTEFSLFLKKGMTAYLYVDLIIEPQVYTAVKHVYGELPLTAVDKAFLPEEINWP